MSLGADSLGSVSWLYFLIGNVGLFGWAAFMSAKAIAETWRPASHCVFYGFLLAIADRLFERMLFAGDLFSVRGFVVDYLVILAIMFASHRVVHVQRVVRQYPWLYERSGPFGLRERNP